MSFIHLSGLTVSFDGKRVLEDLSFAVEKGERWAVIGKNGAGKSTLVKCIAGLRRADSGRISVQDRDLYCYKPRELAKIIAYIPQAAGRTVPPFTVLDYVVQGRYPYQGFFARASEKDRAIATQALELTDTADLAGRSMATLSGGELQRVFLAGAVSQQAEVMVLDEPVSFLDPLHQELVHRALDRIHEEYATTLITVTHDVNNALNHHSHILALVKGAALFSGPAAAMLERCPAILHDVYSIPFERTGAVSSGRVLLVPERIDA